MKEIQILNQSTIKDFIAQNEIVLIDFYADWCGPCKMLAPELDRLLEKYKDKISIGKVNVDEYEDLARDYRIMSIPCVYVFKNGEKIQRIVGYKTFNELEKIILEI